MKQDSAAGGKARELFAITGGCLLMAIGVYFFKFPNHFVTGGVSGVSQLISRLWPDFTPGGLMFVINMVLLLVGFLVFGRSFGLKTAYASTLFSGATWALEWLLPMDKPFTDQPLLELMFAIFLPAVGSALLFNCGASSGGTDVVAMLLRKYTSMDIGRALLISDSLIALASCVVFGLQVGLFSVFGLVMKSLVVDSVIESINLCKYFTIVTAKPEEICEYILATMHRGATIVRGEGAFSHEEKTLLLIACRRPEAVRLRQKVRQVDPDAFLFITNTGEVIGKGFRG